MTTNQQKAIKFTYRTAAVIVNEGRVLLQRSESAEFWCLPGGKVEFLETAADALAREMREELSAEVSVRRLLWMVEDFFFHRGRYQHELGFYFLAELDPAARRLLNAELIEGNEEFYQDHTARLYFRWFPQNADVLNSLAIVPQFLRQGLACLPQQVEHIVNTSL